MPGLTKIDRRPACLALAGVLLALGPGAARGQEPAADAPVSERLRKLEEANQKLLDGLDALSKQNKALADQNQALSKKVEDLSKAVEDGDDAADDAKAGDAGGTRPAGSADRGGSAGGGPVGGSSRSSGGGIRPSTREAQDVGNRRLGRIPLKSTYNYGREGFILEDEDQELQLRVRAELQADAMIYQQQNMDPTHGGLYLPRARFYFQGYVTRPIEYQLSFQHGYNSFNPLNVYLNFNYDPRLQLRIGRFKIPYLYEWYKLNNWRLIAPERSLFALNYQGSRQLGVMAWGQLFDQRLEYAAGVFDGPRNSFQDYNDAKDVAALLNFKPWVTRDGHPLQDLNIGGSVDAGYQNNPLRPEVLRTNVNASTSDVSSSTPLTNATLPFLAFNNGVVEHGMRQLWELHAAYYYKGLSLLAAWEAGTDAYAHTAAGSRPDNLPISGYFVQAAYILTGETIHDRVVVDPLRRFDLRRGKFGLGAWEVHARYSELELSNRVFTQGFADPTIWSNQAQAIDTGLNWYLNKWVKVYFDWQHAMFAQPVYYAPGPKLQKTSDLFWLRFQVYF